MGLRTGAGKAPDSLTWTSNHSTGGMHSGPETQYLSPEDIVRLAPPARRQEAPTAAYPGTQRTANLATVLLPQVFKSGARERTRRR